MAKISKFEFSTSDAIHAREVLTGQMQDIVQRAKDQNRDLTKAEAEQVEQLDNLRSSWQEIEQKSSYLDDVAATSDINYSNLLNGDITGNRRSQVNNLWGDMAAAHYMRENKQRSYEARSITTSTAGAIVQDPAIIDQYYGNLQHTNAIGRLGVDFVTSDTNYQQYPSASGEPVILAHGTEAGALTMDSTWSLQSNKLGWHTRYVGFDISYELAEDAPYSSKIISAEADSAISNDILTQFMQGDGSATPLGLDNLTAINTTDMNGSAFDYSDLVDWYGTVLSNRADPAKLGMLYGTSSWKTFAKLQASDSQYIVPPMALSDFKMEWSSAVREDYATDQTKIYLGDFTNSRVIFSRSNFRMIYSRSQLGTNLVHRYIFVSRYDNMHHRPALLHRIDGVPTS